MNATTILRRAALATVTLAALGTGAAPAGAATKTLNYQCEWPLVGALPLKAEIDVTLPTTTGGSGVPALPVAMRLTSGSAEEGTSTWDGLRIIKAASLESEREFPDGPTLTVSGAGLASPLVSNLSLTIEKYVVPATEQAIVLDATTTIPAVGSAGTGTLSYRLTDFKLPLRLYKADGSVVRLPSSDTDTDEDKPPFAPVPCTLDAGQDPTIATVEVGNDISLPVPPTDLVAKQVSPGVTQLEWTPPADLTDFDHYEVSYDEFTLSVTEPRILLTGLMEDADYYASVVAVSKSGARSEGIDLVFTTLHGDPGPIDECVSPSPPERLVVGAVTETSAALSWQAPIPNAETTVTAYDVYDGATKIATSRTTSTALEGLTPDTAYALTIRARSDFDCPPSVPSPVVRFKTLPRDVGTAFAYEAAGSATLRTLTRGAIPLRGKVDLVRFRSTTQGSIALAPTKARLVALGFIPVTASVQFVSSGATTTTLASATGLQLSTKARIKLPQVSLFGTIPLAGGSTCQTRQLSTIDLSSPGFDPATGGRLTGSFAISDLSGCGALNGLVSAATAGTGNTISLDLEPTR